MAGLILILTTFPTPSSDFDFYHYLPTFEIASISLLPSIKTS